MKKVVYSILILTLTFLLNIGLYYYSENYSFFLKKMKYGDSIINKESLNITDDYIAKNQTCNYDDIKPVFSDSGKLIEENTDIVVNSGTTANNSEITTTNNSGTTANNSEIDELFTYFDKNTLKIKQYDEYYKIFNITDEYPTEYITYNNENFEVYLFLNSKFDDLYNMFELLSKDKTITNKFSLNKLNNFGKKSFFINTINDDGRIRLVVDNGKILFGLYIKKSYYNNIKTILEKI